MIDDEMIIGAKIPPGKYEEIERRVVDLYVEQDIHNMPIDPFTIIKNRGYDLIPFSKFDPYNRPDCIDEDNDAFSFYDPTMKTQVIVYNDEKPLNRIRFTLMHELGHIDLGHKCESDLARKMADYYAGYALAPSPLIGKYASEDSFQISAEFWISLECADICSNRYQNWIMYGGRYLKDYEIKLINLFE